MQTHPFKGLRPADLSFYDFKTRFGLSVFVL